MLCHSYGTYVAQLWHYCRTIVRLSSHRCETIVSRLCDNLKVKDIFLFLKDRQILLLYTPTKTLLFLFANLWRAALMNDCRCVCGVLQHCVDVAR